MSAGRRWLQAGVRLLYPHGSVRRVWRGPVRGWRFEVVAGMGATYALGVDSMNWQFLQRQLRPGMTVYDVGANCGQMALFFSRMVGEQGRVLAFEPVPQNAERLRRNLRLNACENVQVYEMALAAEKGVARFGFSAAHHTMGGMESTLVKLENWETSLDVSCETLDAISAQESPPQLIKVDVEGGGWEVLRGAEQTLTRHAPLIYFELHAANAQAPELQAVNWLRERFGYEVIDLRHTLEGPYGPEWNGAIWAVKPGHQETVS